MKRTRFSEEANRVCPEAGGERHLGGECVPQVWDQ